MALHNPVLYHEISRNTTSIGVKLVSTPSSVGHAWILGEPGVSGHIGGAIPTQDRHRAEGVAGEVIGKIKALFKPPPRLPASVAGRCPLAAPAVPPARGGSSPQRFAARRGTALRGLDMQVRMGKAAAFSPRYRPSLARGAGGSPSTQRLPAAAARSQAWRRNAPSGQAAQDGGGYGLFAPPPVAGRPRRRPLLARGAGGVPSPLRRPAAAARSKA